MKPLYQLLSKIHPYISGLKVHNEILNISLEDNIQLYEICKSYGIFLWEDRKMNDIGNTVYKQLDYYSEYRDIVSVVPLGGPESIPKHKNIGVFLLSQLSCKNNLIHPYMTEEINSLVKNESVCGIICQNPELVSNDTITIMPGIRLDQSSDSKNQQWKTPRMIKYKPTFYVVGRGIIQSDDPVASAQLYCSEYK